MKVCILFDYDDRLEGVYTEAAKEVREQQFYEEAIKNRDYFNTKLYNEIAELKVIRKPYLEEAERRHAEQTLQRDDSLIILAD